MFSQVHSTQPAQRPKDVPLWSYFGRDVPDHNRTNTEHIKVLTFFGSTMSSMDLASGNIDKIP